MIKPVVLTIGPVAGFNKGDEVPQGWIDMNLSQAILLPLRSVVTLENALNMLIEEHNLVVRALFGEFSYDRRLDDGVNAAREALESEKDPNVT